MQDAITGCSTWQIESLEQLSSAQLLLLLLPAREAQKIWMGELLERLRNALRLVSVSVDLSGASKESMKTVCELLVRLEKAISELSIHAGNQLDQIKKNKGH
jgi:hypothetical protein